MTGQRAIIDRLTAALADRYAVHREIGAGGMATVYVARDLRHDRDVAIKVLHPELAASIGPSRFLQEIQIAARLSHPHILPLHDSGDADGLLFYVMPFVVGESLRDRLVRERELPVSEAVRILKDVTDALAYAHEQGVVHRDIKPENVMLSGRHALVADFGVAKALTEAAPKHGMTSAGIALGTPAYMSPEQATADLQLDGRSDVYSVGVMAYELLSGRLPHEGDSIPALIAAKITESARPLLEERPSVPTGLAEAIMRCLERRPADRWQTAVELLSQLETISTPGMGSTPAQTAPSFAAVTATGAAGRAPGRMRRVGLAAVAVLATVGVAAWAGLRSSYTPLPGRVVVAAFEDRTGDPEAANERIDLLERLTAALAGENLDVVSEAAVSDPGRSGSAGASSASAAKILARKAQAAVVLVGAIARVDGALEYRGELLSMPSGTSIVAVPPTRDRALFIQRALVALVANQESGTEFAFTGFALPSNLASLTTYIRGMRTPDSARVLLERAIALDSTWYAPVIEYAARSPTGNTDLAALESLMPSLQAGERDLLQHKRAMWSLDRELMYRTARALFDRSPATFWRPLVQEAMAVNRPAVVIAAGAYRDVPSLTTNPLHPDQNSHLTYGYALHNVGRYKEQLALGAEVRREFPANLRVALIQEIMALAALGRTDELAPLVELSESDADRGAAYLVASQAWMAGQELAAHGNPELAEEYFARWVNRIEEAAAREPNSRQRQVVLAQAYLVAGRFEQAAAHHAALLKSPAPDSLLVIGEYGQALAGLGRRDEANAVIDRLEAIVAGRSENIRRLHQGLISARLGDKPRALAYLRQAVASGSVLFVFQHRNAALNNLRDYPPFIDFVRLRE